MNKNLLIIFSLTFILLFFIILPFTLGAQEKARDILRKYKSYGNVVKQENKLEIYID